MEEIMDALAIVSCLISKVYIIASISSKGLTFVNTFGDY